jgi:hypothetical protein
VLIKISWDFEVEFTGGVISIRKVRLIETEEKDDVAKISWKPDYASFFYEQICKRARNMYLFRDEYILIVERPEVGHATYIFAKPDDIEGFVRACRDRCAVHETV